MRFSKAFLPTLKETPAEAEIISHKLMLRAGMIKKLTSGIYSWLPLGWRVVRKIERIVREEMDRAGAQEIFMPSVQPAELWKESGRWEHYGRELCRFTDRHDNEYCLGPTHEEVVTDIIRREVQGYRELPINLYQVQTKFRDEIRPRFGIMRAREFIMKDAYTFDVDPEASAASYKIMHDAYRAIFDRLGLAYTVVEADSGAIGGSYSHEFMVLAENGEDAIVSCPGCGYGANTEKAPVNPPRGDAPPPSGELAEVATPNAHTVEELARFLGCATGEIAKTMIYLADGKPVAAMVRGDRQVNEIKLKNATGAAVIELAPSHVIVQVTGGPVGFSGPVGLSIPIYADHELFQMAAITVGANKADAHYTGFHLSRAANAKPIDLRMIEPTDPCPNCGGELTFARGIEVGHIFRLGAKYSQAMGATYLDAEGQTHPIVMGCYGIGVTRIAAAAIEQGFDDNGIIFPLAIAPYSVAVLPMGGDGEVAETAEKIYRQLWDNGVEALLDDRDLRGGVKFKDADLMGIPLRVVVGAKGLKQGKVEFKRRAGGEVEMIDSDAIVEFITRTAREGKAQTL